MHCTHDVGMGVEGPSGKANVRRSIVAETSHQILSAAHDADRKAAGHGLPIGDHVGANPEILLGAAASEPEAHEYLIENQHNPALGAHRSKLLQPSGVARSEEHTSELQSLRHLV